MAYTLNTSHPLYGNLIELIGVQSGALVSHKTARTFTKDVAASYGTGTYGEHFVSVKGGNYTPQGASFTPALSTDGTAHGLTIVYVVNNIDAASSHGGMLSGNSAGTYRIPSVGVDGAGKAQITAGMDSYSASGTTTVLNSGAYSLASTRKAGAQTSTSATLYVNGALEATGGTGINEVTTGNTIDYIGGTPGQTAAGAKFVWIAYFDRELTTAEILSLHNSLGANNAFGLVQSSGGSASTAISATLANITGSVASKSSPKTVISATLANVTASVGHTTGTLKTTITATLGNVVGSITSTGSTTNGTFTSEVLKDYSGNVLANTTLNFVRFYNDTTGALVLSKTGVSTNGAGIVTFSDASLAAGTTYRVDWETTAGSRRMPRKAAS